MFRSNPRARLTLRWGGGIALLLAIQSLLLAGIFWTLTTQSRLHDQEMGFRGDCREFSLMGKGERMEELRQALDRDIHRDRFLALFDSDGALLEGNVAHLPAAPAPARSGVAMIRPTELPGKTNDEARYAVCTFPDGTRLFTGVDLDDAQYAARVALRALLFGLVPSLLIAILVGTVAGRRAARQVDALSIVTKRIMAGDLRERLPVSAGPPDSFGLLGGQINAMLDRLETLIADVRGIGDDIAHQVRTPLTRLRARVERAMATADSRETFSAVAVETLADVDKLLGIVAAILRIRELEHHERKSRFARLDLRQIVMDACDLYRPIAEEQGGKLDCHIQPTQPVVGDASLMMEAIANLIDNAVKFGPVGGTVSVTLQNQGAAPVITIADQGTGVPLADRSAVTQRFYRGRRDCGGVGLGLTLVSAIADLHGFALRFEPQHSAVSLACGMT